MEARGSNGSILIETVGAIHIEGADGENLTPTGSRLRAVLVVLALNPRKRASRRWLETLFWADRSSELASGSLRQALAGIRRSLGPYADILKADRIDVALNADRVRVDVLDDPVRTLELLESGRELLEGVDIASEPFEDWLRQERSVLHDRLSRPTNGAVSPDKDQHTGPPDMKAEPILYTQSVMAAATLESFMAEAVCAQLAQTATSHLRTEVRSLDGPVVPVILSPGARCSIRVLRQNNDFVAIARLTQEPKGNVFWVRQLRFDGEDPDARVDAAAALALEATEALTACSAQASNAQMANGMATSALEDIFSFERERLLAADQKLEEANALDPHAPRPALQALGRAFFALEDPDCDQDDLGADVDQLISKSMALDATNPLAQAFLADVHDLVFDDSQTAMSLLSCALKRDPGIGFAYASLGVLELRRGKLEEARSAALRAQRQLVNSSLEVFSLMRLCVTSMNAGHLDEATEAAKKAALLAPFSCPPLRHLYALRLHQGDLEGARRALRALQRIEPDFSMRRLREDPSFPAPSLRQMGFHQLTDVEI